MGNHSEHYEGIHVMPKFDVAIMNPPYDGNLHLKILEAVIPVADKVVKAHQVLKDHKAFKVK